MKVDCMDDVIFALDIGTRSVVGVVCEKKGGTLKVLEIKSVIHKQRSMMDGQIEDIPQVSRVVGVVKDELEKSLNIKLNKVCIAAAGRALKTERVSLEKPLDIRVPVSAEFKNAAETEALQLAQDVFSGGSDNSDLFYCVGYSVLSCALDGRSMANVVGHRGNKLNVEIIAAFLPHTVVEGLYTCMDNNNLEVVNLTLEPIAAMDLIIPPELRLLNLALIDIGAGTSDIAISKGGSIVGYDMATIAGDEITENIMKSYLTDFNTAEKIKAALSDDTDRISITNILGTAEDVDKKEILETIKPAVYDLCADVSLKITKMNKEAPAAVFLAGGGSKTPLLRDFMSELLNVPKQRIALTNKASLSNVDLSMVENFGPELITPIGIAYSVILNKNYDFFSVGVNGKKVRLYGIRQMKVMDAILMSGFDTKKLIGFSGKSLRFTLNGKEYYYAGELSVPARICVNSQPANIETVIKPGDSIEITAAENGNSPVVKICHIAGEDNKGRIVFNGINTELRTRYYVNGEEVGSGYVIKNSDSVEVLQPRTIKDIYRLLDMDPDKYVSYVKESKAEGDFLLYDGCIISALPADSDGRDEPHEKNSGNMKIPVNEKISGHGEIPGSETDNAESHDKGQVIHVTVNDNVIELPPKDDNLPYIFADMLNYTDIDPSNPKGNIILLHNGRDASYLNLISDKDVITIKWDSET